ncbi:hypothetical protein ACXGQW_04590 [Wenyingzhuangia sp. IMCC45533]
MKLFKKLLLVVVAIVSLNSCDEDDKNEIDVNTSVNGSLSAKIDGKDFVSNSLTASISEITLGQTTSTTIQGTDSDGNAISILILGYKKSEDLARNNIAPKATFTYTKTDVDQAISNPVPGNGAAQIWTELGLSTSKTAKLNITEDDGTTIKGTFAFKGVNSQDDSTRSITEGKFELKRK